MYAFIRGTVEYKEDGMLAIDAGGMGYEVRVTEFVYMDTQEGGDVMLYLVCITNGTDGSRTLYGFQTRDEKRMFLHLISVTRIGGKVALAILSRLTLAEIASAVATADPTPPKRLRRFSIPLTKSRRRSIPSSVSASRARTQATP